MRLHSIYICPVRGLDRLEPPDPHRLFQAAQTARESGLRQLYFPVLEEALLAGGRSAVRYLDGLVTSLDQTGAAGLKACLLAPAQHLLGMDWIPPALAGARASAAESVVFTSGRVRNLRPFPWWQDPATVRRRVGLFREVVSAVAGHPILTGWVLLNRVLDWSRPDWLPAEILLRSYLAEIRQRDESVPVYLKAGWGELLDSDYLLGKLSSPAEGLILGDLGVFPYDSPDRPAFPL